MGLTGRPGPRSMSGGGHVLVTGGAGFIGSNLVERLASGGEKVLIYDWLARAGVEDNLKRLTERYPDRVSLVVADVRDHQALGEAAAGASAVFHLAAQVAVTTSMVAPEEDFDVNCHEKVKLLEALRRSGRGTPMVFESTNKVYGDLTGVELAMHKAAWQTVYAASAAAGVNHRQQRKSVVKRTRVYVRVSEETRQQNQKK